MREVAEKQKAQNQRLLGNGTSDLEIEEYELIHEKASIHGEANKINSTTSKLATDIDS